MRAYSRLWREMFGLCWRRHPVMTTLALALHVFHAVAFAAVGLALRALVDAIGLGRGPVLAVAAFAAAAALAVDWTVGELADVMTIHLVDRVGLCAVEPEIIGLCVGLEGIDHLERAEFLDRVTAVRGQGWAIVESAWSVLLSVLVGLRLLTTLALLGTVDPWLLLLVACAGTQLWLDRYGKRRVIDAEIAVAEDTRLQRGLFEILTSPSAGKEVRVTGVGAQLLARQAAAWNRVVRTKVRARAVATLWSATGWAVFAAGYTVGLGFLVTQSGTPGNLVLAVTIGAQLRDVLQQAVSTSAGATESRRVLQPFLWLRGYATEHSPAPDRPLAPPARIREGITLDNVSLTYPAADRPAVEGVSVFLPAGSVVAVVGEYGSGKTTLVKLLAKLYRPSAGTIRVDGHDLAELDTVAWRASMSAAFQDFGRYQVSFAEAVGLGDLTAPPGTLAGAIADADATGLVNRLPLGARTQLGGRFGGVELSEGQWQKVALARACMRRTPLLFVLDEPTASLDAPSEHAIFQRYLARSHEIAAATGGMTLIVSHRFSTVADADLILVMSQGRLIESGSHADLMALGGSYAALYGIQASAYARN